jgi:hypothetical protein
VATHKLQAVSLHFDHVRQRSRWTTAHRPPKVAHSNMNRIATQRRL